MQTWCNENIGVGSWNTLYGQLMFMNYELGVYGMLSMLQSIENNSEGAYNAEYEFCMNYEKPERRDKPYTRNGITYLTESEYRALLARDTYYPTLNCLYGNIIRNL